VEQVTKAMGKRLRAKGQEPAQVHRLWRIKSTGTRFWSCKRQVTQHLWYGEWFVFHSLNQKGDEKMWDTLLQLSQNQDCRKTKQKIKWRI